MTAPPDRPPSLRHSIVVSFPVIRVGEVKNRLDRVTIREALFHLWGVLLLMSPFWSVLRVVCLGVLLTKSTLLAEEKATGVARWESDIQAFEAADKATALTPGGVMFYGSSSARLWDLKAAFPTLQTVNRGFGGSDMEAAAHFYDRVVPPHHPRVVVLYEGDNDLASGRTPCQILADFESLIAKQRAVLPESKLICLTIKYSPSRAKLRLDQEAANALLKARCAKDSQLVFVDLASTLLGDQGEPQPKYFMPDMLHLNPEGYAQWNAKLRPVIEEALAKVKPSVP